MRRSFAKALVTAAAAAWFMALPPANPSGPGLCGFNAPLNQWFIISGVPFASQQACRAAIQTELHFLRSINPPQLLSGDKCTQCIDELPGGLKR